MYSATSANREVPNDALDQKSPAVTERRACRLVFLNELFPAQRDSKAKASTLAKVFQWQKLYVLGAEYDTWVALAGCALCSLIALNSRVLF